jgi:hypothetical protein
MALTTRTVYDLNEQFKIQLELLKLTCSNYDNNIEIAGFNIATSIRVFLHDTRNSTSALTHIGHKAIDYLDTCTVNSNTGVTFTGLIYSYFEGVHDGKGGVAKFRPLFTRNYQKQVCH